jgi:ArsR family transcriptional regulator, virulence genes transcriptional regulator
MDEAMSLEAFERNASEVAAVLRSLANRRRLMVLCRLAEHGEMRVGDLAEAAGLSQSALSQHLARLREEGLVAFRRESQSLWYRIADARCEALLTTLHQLYCQED